MCLAAAQSLYYHVDKLVGAGLVQEHSRRLSGKRMETLYEPVAASVTVAAGARSRTFLEALGKVYRSALKAAERGLQGALDHERRRKRGPREAQLRQRCVRLDNESAAAVRRKLAELDQLLEHAHDPGARRDYLVTTVFSPVHPR